MVCHLVRIVFSFVDLLKEAFHYITVFPVVEPYYDNDESHTLVVKNYLAIFWSRKHFSRFKPIILAI